jgi:uncharacterized protein (DUF488 family)
MQLYTIGHSNHSIDAFAQLLDANGVMVLVDVRTTPLSRYVTQFNRDNLERVLPEHQIQYVFAGKFLGGRPADPTCYKKRKLPGEGADYQHEVDYPAVMQHDWFVKGIQRLLELADEQTTVVMCSEEDPAQCHRHHLIAKYLMEHHPEVTVRHIRGDGSVFNAATLRVSVEDKQEPQQPSLF